MILQKEDFEKMGFEVKVLDVPVIVVAGVPVAAKTFSYDSIEHLKKESWFIDALVQKDRVPLFLCDLKVDKNKQGICFRAFILDI